MGDDFIPSAVSAAEISVPLMVKHTLWGEFIENANVNGRVLSHWKDLADMAMGTTPTTREELNEAASTSLMEYLSDFIPLHITHLTPTA
jgi:hypothetical protein